MTNRIVSLLEQVKALSLGQQTQLLAQPQDLVSPPDLEWEKARADECERRAAALTRGETELIDADDAMARTRAKIAVWTPQDPGD